MQKASFLVRAAVAAALAAATPIAEAQTRVPGATPACAERTAIVQRLADRYGETLQSMGLHQSNALLEVYASPDTGTWTILMTRPDGQACLLAAGRMWEANAAPLTPAGDDA